MSDINFTFGIITDFTKEPSEYIPEIIQSIKDLNIPNYEILLVGDRPGLDNLIDSNIDVIHFNSRPGWITRQKNLITKRAKYENIVYQHDYICYDKDWYEGFKSFGNNFDLCMNKILNADGVRFRDWVLFPYHNVGHVFHESHKLWKYTGIHNNESMLPYDENRLKRFQYISGSYWVAKKYVMNNFPLDESLGWGQGEDVTFSLQVLKKYNLVMNQNSTVHFLKQKVDAFTPIKDDCYKRAIEYVTK